MAKSLGIMTRKQVVDRARSAIGRPTIYSLGAGGRAPQLRLPDVKLDCSGFVAWAMGVDRYLPNGAIPHLPGGDWLECSNVYEDAKTPLGFAAEVPWNLVMPGDVLVWPDRGDKQGHIGIVTLSNELGPIAVIHCSAGNYRNDGDAIQETDATLFKKNGAIAARIAWVED